MKKVWVFLVTGVMVILVIQFPHIMINPGELVSGHQNLEKECQACHDPFRGISNAKCISCHKLADIGKDTLKHKKTLGFHKAMADRPCISCHSDHKGVHPLVTISNFDHNMFSANDLANCTTCHDKPVNAIHMALEGSCGSCHSTDQWKRAIFDHSMIGNAQRTNCVSCHAMPSNANHRNFGSNCNECHLTSHWLPSTFDHASYFLLDNEHNASCSTCHTGNDYSSYTCYGCHEHSPGKIREEHMEEGISDFTNCISCHKSGNEHDVKGGHGEHDHENDD